MGLIHKETRFCQNGYRDISVIYFYYLIKQETEMRTNTYKWIIEQLSNKESCLHQDNMRDNREYLIELISDKDNLSRELNGNWNNMNDYLENMETLREQNNINTNTDETH